MDIVSLGNEKGGGAYFRKEIIVIEKINVSDDVNEVNQYAIELLGHELGHNWFTGADTTTWEDWLNETGAEWAGLLYLLSFGDKTFLEYRLRWPKEKYREMSVIKSPDGKRPTDSVHTRGFMMFYEIYQKYGIETITEILKVLVDIKQHTTAAFLSDLKAKMGGEIPGVIERGLTMKDYAELFNVH